MYCGDSVRVADGYLIWRWGEGNDYNIQHIVLVISLEGNPPILTKSPYFL